MSKKFSEEEFQQFIVEQLGKLSGQVSTVQDDVTDLRTDQQSLRKTVANVVDGQRELRSEIGKLRGEIADVKEDLRPIAIAVDKDALKIVQHERRIKVLERHGALKRAMQAENAERGCMDATARCALAGPHTSVF